MRTRKLELACPLCGSAEVFYSCTPNCCFNHVCSACGATFEPATRRTGGSAGAVSAPEPPPEATDPAAECAACGSPTVYLSAEGRPVCGKCGAWLELEYTEVAEA